MNKPSPLQSPREVLDRSWMANPDDVKHLDNEVRGRLAAARAENRMPEQVPAHSVDVLVDHVHRGVRYKRWFVATTACALLGELIYASERGGIYKVPALLERDSKYYERDSRHQPLELLRNACVHPAMVVGKGQKGPAMARLVEAIRRTADGKPFARWLDINWTGLHEDVLTFYALTWIDRAGRYELNPGNASFDRR